jgi:hypothetical protein
LFEECLAAVDAGMKLAHKVAKQIPEFPRIGGGAGQVVEEPDGNIQRRLTPVGSRRNIVTC